MFCLLQMAVTALVASLNPAIVARQNTGIDSEEVSITSSNNQLAPKSGYAFLGCGDLHVAPLQQTAQLKPCSYSVSACLPSLA